MNGFDLYADGYLKGQPVPADVIHQSCDEFIMYDPKNFSTNLTTLREFVAKKKKKAEEQRKAINQQSHFVPPAEFHGLGQEKKYIRDGVAIWPKSFCASKYSLANWIMNCHKRMMLLAFLLYQ